MNTPMFMSSIRETYKILPISLDQYREWLLKKHYAKRLTCIEYGFGLFDVNLLVGVVTFGTPMSPKLRGIFDDKYKILELNRLCVNNDLPKNVLSFFVSASLKILPRPVAIVSYADISKNHVGYIYQATNFIYTGLSEKRTDWKLSGKEHLHGGTIADISRGNKNRSKWMKEKFGDDFYLLQRPRKHRYFKFLGSKRDIKNMLKMFPYEIIQYPKGDSIKYNTDYKPTVQLILL